MEFLKDKVIGSWVGMAVGEAMGLAVKGLKPETIHQLFREMDGFKEVGPFLGKGIKHYRMQGLYGAQTQMALAVCDCLLKSRKVRAENLSELFQRLSSNGPENYLGVFRNPEGAFRKSLEWYSDEPLPFPAEQNTAGCGYAVMTIPIALFHRKSSPAMLEQCLESILLMSRNPMEVFAGVLSAYLVTRFLAMEPPGDGGAAPNEQAATLLEAAAGECYKETQAIYSDRFPEVWEAFDDKIRAALPRTLQVLADRFHMEREQLVPWICQNASELLHLPISSPAQGHVLTLLPLALVLVLQEGTDFQGTLTRALNMGKEAHKLGALAGAWAGAIHGFAAIPEAWKSGLVNAREIKARGEALFMRRAPKGLKDLYGMELGLTQKESEERKRYMPKRAHKPAKKIPAAADAREGEGEDSSIPRKEDAAQWRKFQKDKTRMKRDRRRHLKFPLD
ncbi:MAG: ADP-ribosylglycohydrolase family protein [Nitrospinaceae bacterium]